MLLLAAGKEGWDETWLVLEWCGHGDLANAFQRGWLNLPGTHTPSLAAVLLTASEVASGLSVLHAEGVVHGNLNGDKCAPGHFSN